MTRPSRFASNFFACSILLLTITGGFTAGAVAAPVSRSVTFELTFANSDLVWRGDAASPTAQIFVKPGAKPVATDAQVTTLAEQSEKPGRRYMREARIANENGAKTVYAFTAQREKVIGTVDGQGKFLPNEFYKSSRALLPSWPTDVSLLHYDEKQNALYQNVDLPGPELTETLDFLPLLVTDPAGKPVSGRFTIDYSPAAADKASAVTINLHIGSTTVALARANLPRYFLGSAAQTGSFDNKTGTYLPESAYRAGATAEQSTGASVTFQLAGEFTSDVKTSGETLALAKPLAASAEAPAPAKITIDGNFDDWRNVSGIDDPRGDLVPYLEYIPDVDLLEFKVTNDDERIFFYARVAGQVGKTAPHGGRSYFYAYMDVDRNPGTGFLPTRDDDCYYGVDIGDDCEVQFEFVDNAYRKGFYGFCGKGGDENVLKQVLTLGKSQYGRFDDAGAERADYKTEYIYHGGKTEVTEDLKLGDSDTIRVAVSPDGHEVEVSSTLAGFLKNAEGKPTLALGQTIDLAIGMETDSKAYPMKSRWGADNTIPIRGYTLRPTKDQRK